MVHVWTLYINISILEHIYFYKCYIICIKFYNNYNRRESQKKNSYNFCTYIYTNI